MNRRTFIAAAGTALGSTIATTTAANTAPAQSSYEVEFDNCTHAVLRGTFTDSDIVYANTGWYDDTGLYGNTLLEHGFEFGPDADNDIPTPFEGEIHINVGRIADLTATENTISLVVPGAQDDAVITSLTTDPDDYMQVAPTHSNPHAEECLSAAEDETDPAEFEVSVLETNTPIEGGEYLEVTASVENRGGKSEEQDVSLIVGHNPQQVDSQTVSLDSMTGTTITLGYTTPPVKHTQEFPVYVESEDTGARQNVRVAGVGK